MSPICVPKTAELVGAGTTASDANMAPLSLSAPRQPSEMMLLGHSVASAVPRQAPARRLSRQHLAPAFLAASVPRRQKGREQIVVVHAKGASKAREPASRSRWLLASVDATCLTSRLIVSRRIPFPTGGASCRYAATEESIFGDRL
jgi:hypothetical protein